MQEKKEWLAYGWRLLCPLLLYEVLSLAIGSFVGAPMDLSMMERTFIVELAGIPLFWNLYQKDGGNGRLASENQVPLVSYYVVWALSGAAALAFLSSQLLSLTPLIEWSERFQEVDQAIGEESAGLKLLTTVLAAPVMEELLMRGLVYGRLRERLKAGPAILWSALLFGALHGNLIQGIHAFVVGLFLAWLMERFRNILVPILGHMAANLMSMVLIPSERGIDYVLELAVAGACVIRAIQILKNQEN